MKALRFLALLPFISLAWGATDALRFADDASFNHDFKVFPISTEMQIGKTQHFFTSAISGVLVSVGSERTFREASMMPQATKLIQIDIAEPIVRFNLINKELLKTPDRKEYLHLRWDATFLEWKAFMDRSFKNHTRVHLSPADFEWWSSNVRDLSSMSYPLPEHLNRYQKAPKCVVEKPSPGEMELDLGQILDYKTGNYLFYDNLYKNLHRLAINDNIVTIQVNLKNDAQVLALIEFLKEQDAPVSVLDLDNLYFETYLGEERYHRITRQLLHLGIDSSLLLVMSNYKEYACGEYQLYLGFTFEHVRKWPVKFRMQSFIDKLPEQTHDLIDGRLYEHNEPLPGITR